MICLQMSEGVACKKKELNMYNVPTKEKKLRPVFENYWWTDNCYLCWTKILADMSEHGMGWFIAGEFAFLSLRCTQTDWMVT